MSGINIKELAKILNLSKSTVSRAFMGHADINQKTKERIFEAARELHYVPNRHASNLRAQRSRNIAIIVPGIADNFYSRVINGIETITREKGYYPFIYLTSEVFAGDAASANNLQHTSAEGIIMSVSGERSDHSYISQLQEKLIPLVLFDRVYDDINTAKVITDDYTSSFEATRHLVGSGCKNIAFLTIDKQFSVGKLRFQGYAEALKHAGLPLEKELVINCGSNDNQNMRIITDVLKSITIDGLFAAEERLAFSAYHACNELKISIPNDVKVISFSSLEIASLLNPALTTVTQPAYEMGVQAATLLFKMIERKDPVNEQIVLPSKIIARSSTLGCGI